MYWTMDCKSCSASVSVVTFGTFLTLAYAGESKALTADLPETMGSSGEESVCLNLTFEVVDPFTVESTNAALHT